MGTGLINNYIPAAPNRDGVKLNEDGSVSSHRMRTESDAEGNWFSFPTLFQNEDGSWDDRHKEADSNWESVYEEAKRRGEVITFGSDKESALKYGQGSWKK